VAPGGGAGKELNAHKNHHQRQDDGADAAHEYLDPLPQSDAKLRKFGQ
jgi:hypothetical protein